MARDFIIKRDESLLEKKYSNSSVPRYNELEQWYKFDNTSTDSGPYGFGLSSFGIGNTFLKNGLVHKNALNTNQLNPSGYYFFSSPYVGSGFTYSAWIFPTSDQVNSSYPFWGYPSQTLFGDEGYGYSPQLFLKGLGNGNLKVVLCPFYNVFFTSNQNIPINTWTHLCITFNFTTYSADIYINASLGSWDITPYSLFFYEMYYLNFNGYSGLPYIGRMNDAMFFYAELTPSEILTLYNLKDFSIENIGLTEKNLPIKSSKQPYIVL